MPDTSAPARAVFKSVTIDRPAAEVHAFLADVTNWPRWAVRNILAVEPSEHAGWWTISTPYGPAEIRLHTDSETGIVDHDFRDPDHPDDPAVVPARVVANGRGALFSMTIFQPAELSDGDFDREMAGVDTELATLKDLLERGPAAGQTSPSQ